MSFTAQELQNISAAALDFFIKGPALKQFVQERPLLSRLTSKQKTFSGGKGGISIPIKGQANKYLQGYSHDDRVGFSNPANIKRAVFNWFELHAGISFTQTELKKDGLSMSDSNSLDDGTQAHSKRDLHVLTGLLDDKLDDMAEGWAIDFNLMLWLDGTQDAKAVPGILSMITDNPTVGTVGTIDRAVNPFFRNRALVGANKIVASAPNQTLTRTLRSEVRQLRRFGGRPNFILCGSQFLDALELEVQEKGIYTQQGFVKNGTTDIGLPSISMQGVGDFVYDPTLDDLGLSKRSYVMDDKHIRLYVMEGEDKKVHNPYRPADQYVVFQATTWTGGLTGDMYNCHGVYEVA
jgi:hypothetical protein